MSDELFRQGVSAARAGDLDAARKLFTEVLKQNPRHINAWLALGHCLPDPEQKKYCFSKVLSLDPEHEMANRLLQELNRQSAPVAEHSLPPGEPKDNLPSHRQQPTRPKRPTAVIAVTITGCVIGAVLVGVLLYSLLGPNPPAFIDQIAQAIAPDSGGQIPVAPANTLPPAWTKTPTTSPTVYISPSVTPTPGLAQLYLASNPDIAKALQYMESGKYAQAILVWDKVIDALPDYAEAYYQRGICYYKLLENQRFLEEYLGNAEQSYADFTTAIELSPTIGDYYSKRVDTLDALTGAYEFRVDKEPLYDQVLEDILQAYSLGNNYTWGTRSVGIALLNAGHCEMSLDYLLRLEKEKTANDRETTPSGSIPRFIAQAYSCLGQNSKAVSYNEVAIENIIANGDSPRDALVDRVRILHALGRYTEAFEIIDTWIEEDPYYRGWRYYLRALLYYELDQPDLAYEDLNSGFGNTWGQYGVRAYVLGRLALDDGDKDSGLYWLQLAEASLSEITEKYLLEQTREEIRRLGGTYLFPTPTPRPKVASTPIPVIADYLYFTPTPPAQIPQPTQVNYLGSGMVFLLPSESEVLLFRPHGYHTVHEVVALTLKITAEESQDDLAITASFLPLDGRNFEESIELMAGENSIAEPQQYVNSEGYFYVLLLNLGVEPIIIPDIQARLDTLLPDGTQISYGYTEDE
jgi:tetratricopeptide (TPR) repeat protein